MPSAERIQMLQVGIEIMGVETSVTIANCVRGDEY